MPMCEKCWADAYMRMRERGGAQADHYRDLLEERREIPCSAEEQVGQFGADRDAATEGDFDIAHVFGENGDGPMVRSANGDGTEADDAALIAGARSWLPLLCREVRELQAIVTWVEGKCAAYPEQAYPIGQDKSLPRIQQLQCAMHQVFSLACAKKTYERIAVEQQSRAESAEKEAGELRKERDDALDILWRDIDDLRDPKLTLVQVAAKAANAIYWRGKSLEEAAESSHRLLVERQEKQD
jgi:hypothetical protein